MLLLIGIGVSSAVLKQMRDSEEKYRNLINTASDGILVIDAQTRVILEANNKAGEMLGIPDGQLVGMPESRLYPGGEGNTVRAPLSPNAAGTERSQVLKLQRADGTIVPVEVNASAARVKWKAGCARHFPRHS